MAGELVLNLWIFQYNRGGRNSCSETRLLPILGKEYLWKTGSDN